MKECQKTSGEGGGLTHTVVVIAAKDAVAVAVAVTANLVGKTMISNSSDCSHCMHCKSLYVSLLLLWD